MALAGDHLKVLVGGYELTGDGHKLTVNDQRNTYEVTAFGDVVHTFIPGARLMTLDHAGYLNAAAARSHPVLKSAELKGVVTVMLGQNADPEVGVHLQDRVDNWVRDKKWGGGEKRVSPREP